MNGIIYNFKKVNVFIAIVYNHLKLNKEYYYGN